MRPAPIREAPANYISGRNWNESSDFPMGEWFHAGNLLVDAAMLIINDLAVTDRVPTPTELQEFSDWEFAAEIPWSLGISGVVVNTAAADGVYPVELLVEQGEFGTFTKGRRRGLIVSLKLQRDDWLFIERHSASTMMAKLLHGRVENGCERWDHS
jgi:hypothetical protein